MWLDGNLRPRDGTKLAKHQEQERANEDHTAEAYQEKEIAVHAGRVARRRGLHSSVFEDKPRFTPGPELATSPRSRGADQSASSMS